MEFYFALLTLIFLGVTSQASAQETTRQASNPQDLTFVADLDGSEQRYVQILPAGFDAEQPVSLLIALHGHGSDRWQFIRDERAECRAARDAATEHRMVFVSPDYRASTSWMGPAAEADLVQLIDNLKSEFNVEQIVLSGGSMGATSALTFAALHPDLIDGVVSLNGTANLVEYERFQEAISVSFGGSKEEIPDEYRKRSAEFHVDALTMPIAMTTGGKDDIVPPASIYRLATALSERDQKVKLIDRPEGGHDSNYDDSKAAFEFVIGELK